MTATDDTAADEPRPDRSRALLWVLGGLVLVMLLVGVIVGAARGPAALDPQSPEGVVQSYITAVLDHDYGLAAGYLSEATAQRCPAWTFRDTWVPDDLVADLDAVRIRDGRAEVRVQLRQTAEPLPFDFGSVDPSIETFVLSDEDGPWRITDDPWPLLNCEPPERP